MATVLDLDNDAMTPTQAALMLGCSPPTIRRRVESGRLPAIKVAMGRLISRDAVEAPARELLDYGIYVDQNANDTYRAFRLGTYDDLVTALGLAVNEPELMETRFLW